MPIKDTIAEVLRKRKNRVPDIDKVHKGILELDMRLANLKSLKVLCVGVRFTHFNLRGFSSFGSDAMWVITEALANCQIRPNLPRCFSTSEVSSYHPDCVTTQVSNF